LAEARGLRLLAVLARCRPAIVHSRLILSNLWARCGALFGARVICEERGLADERPRLMTRLNRATQGLCAMNVANSRAVTSRMRTRDGIPERKLRIIHGGIDCARFRPASDSATPLYDLVTVTRLERYKGVFDLLDAMWRVRQRRPGTRLSIVGDGSQR